MVRQRDTRLPGDLDRPGAGRFSPTRHFRARAFAASGLTVFEPKATVYEAAESVARDLDLPPGWLNDAVKGFLAGDDPAAAPVLDLPGLRVLAASPSALLALKVLAHRVGEDEDDIRLLAAELGIGNAAEVLAVAERTFGDRLDPAARFFVEQIFPPAEGS